MRYSDCSQRLANELCLWVKGPSYLESRSKTRNNLQSELEFSRDFFEVPHTHVRVSFYERAFHTLPTPARGLHTVAVGTPDISCQPLA